MRSVIAEEEERKAAEEAEASKREQHEFDGEEDYPPEQRTRYQQDQDDGGGDWIRSDRYSNKKRENGKGNETNRLIVWWECSQRVWKLEIKLLPLRLNFVRQCSRKAR